MTPVAAERVRKWLTEPAYAEFAPAVVAEVESGNWKTLEDAFWTVIPFGTAGRRGRMHPFGTATINDRTIGESAQGLADYLRALRAETGEDEPLRCAVAYDTRHRSRHFAELCAEVMVASGFHVYFFDGHRPTPELAFTVRAKHCHCGIMISASHNPPSDNAIKVFWSTGGQLNAPHDAAVIARVAEVTTIGRTPFAEALSAGKIEYCHEEMDRRYQEAVLAQGFAGPRDVKIVYSPLHGVGLTSVAPVLRADGFHDVEIFAPHAQPDGDFPNVPDHVANPENPPVFDALIARAQEIGAELCLASDPDADRIGAAAPITIGGAWRTLNGNQIGVLLADYVLRHHREAERLTSSHYVVTTIVSTDMLRRLAAYHNVGIYDDLFTGFKWIGGRVDEVGPAQFVFGFEEAHGYLAGDYIRDKDGAVAAMLMAELAAECKQAGRTLHEQLDVLYRAVGCHLEKTVPLTMPGADGMTRMAAIMERLRSAPPATIGGLQVTGVRDYLHRPHGPTSDLLVFDLAGGNRAAVRPSGTEPKIKFYLFTFEHPERSQDVAAAKRTLGERLAQLEADFMRYGR
jgi:phosphomannomutase